MIKVVSLFILCLGATFAQTTVQFSAEPSLALSMGPFPANVLTTADPSQLTGVRVALPSSADACHSESLAVCTNTSQLNKLDGFSLNPRLMICFSDAISPDTLSAAITLQPVNGPNSRSAVSVTQIVFDKATKCAFAKPAQILAQDTTYLLLVSNSLLDQNGDPVTAAAAFGTCLTGPDAYCSALGRAVEHLRPAITKKLVAASLFTTMSATSWLEQARKFTVTRAPSLLVPAGFPSRFTLSNLDNLKWLPDGSVFGPSQDIPLNALSHVDSIAFGLFLSPNYLSMAGPDAGTIPATPTARPIALPNIYLPVSYHVFLPATPKKGRIPVVIYGHGLGDNQFGAPTYMASTLAKSGFATLAFEVTGHGFGPLGRVLATSKTGRVSTEFTPGRGVQLPGMSAIGPTDGCIVPGAVAIRDCTRQTAVDLFALVKAIRATNGLGLRLDPDRIYYVGQSLGSTYGTLFNAVEPGVKAAVLNGAGGTSVDVARLSISGRDLAIAYVGLNAPALFNVPPAPAEPYFGWRPDQGRFNQSYPFRDSAPVICDEKTLPNAVGLQSAFEAAEWLDMTGDPLAFAPHLHTSPLRGVPKKSILFQFGLGDLEVPNPAESHLITAANAQASTSFLRFDMAAGLHPELLGVSMLPDPASQPFPILPHRVLSNPTIWDSGNEAEKSIAMAEQGQAADFFSSGGRKIPDANTYLTLPFSQSDHLFITPAILPESLNYLQIPK